MVSNVPKNRPVYPDEFRREAVQMLRAWRRQDQVDRHERDDGLTGDERDELRRLRRENARLKQERDLLKRAAAFLARETRLPSESLGIGPGPYRWAVELHTPTDEQRVNHYDSVPED